MVKDISDVVLIHPSVVMSGDLTELGRFIYDILSHTFYQNKLILLESPNNFLKSNPLSKKYQEMIDSIKILSESYKGRIFMIAGESVFSCAKVLINEKKNVCFVGFPYPELRSLHQWIIDSKATGCSYVICDFNKKYKLSPTDLIKDGKMAPDLSKINNRYMSVGDLNNLKCREEFSQIEAYKDAMTPASYLYIYEVGTKKMILKSIKRPARDYIAKIEDLIDLRNAFIDLDKEEALPQRVVYDGETAIGVVFNYIEGPSLDNLYYDNYYQKFMEKNGFKADIVNRIYILIQLYATISEYHSMGIYLSDIKGDNFIVTKNCRIIPIDSDGFSYYKYYSSCPRQEMMYSPEKDHKKAFLQKKDIEQYAVMTMTYCFLMNGNSPYEKEGVTLKDINDASDRVFKTERDRKLVERWRQFPKYIRDVLYHGLVENKVYDNRALLALFMKYFMELTHESTEELWEWATKKVQLQPLVETNIAAPIELFDIIEVKKKDDSRTIADVINIHNKYFDKNNRNTRKSSNTSSIHDASNKGTSTAKRVIVNGLHQDEVDSNESNTNNVLITLKTSSAFTEEKGYKKNQDILGTKGNNTPVPADEEKKDRKNVISIFTDIAKVVLCSLLILLLMLVFFLLSYPEAREYVEDYISAIVLEEEAEQAEERLNASIDDDYSIIRADVVLTTSKGRINTKVGEEVTIQIGVEGKSPDELVYGFFVLDGVEGSWGEFADDDSISLTIIGTEKGVYILRLYLYDYAENEEKPIAYKDVCVNIY